MSKIWDEYGADSLRLGLINFLLVNCRDKSWELHHLSFLGRWNCINKYDLHNLMKMPKLRSGGCLRLIAPSSKEIAIVITRYTPCKGSPYFAIIKSIKDELVPNNMRWPRSEDFDYQSAEWGSWISFIGRLANDNFALDWHPNIEPSGWAKLLASKFSQMIPLDDRSAILKAYREHGF